MKIIQAKITDIELLAPLFDAYRCFYEQPSDLSLAKTFLTERIEHNESVIFLAIKEGKAVGFTQLYPSFSSISAQNLWILNDLYVVPEMRGEGIGEAILNHAKTFARNTHAKGLSLQTRKTNPAQKLYEKLGWGKDEAFFQYFWKTNFE